MARVEAAHLRVLFGSVMAARLGALVITTYLLHISGFYEANPITTILVTSLAGSIITFVLLLFGTLLIIDSVPRTNPRWYGAIFVFYSVLLLLSLLDLGNDLNELNSL